MQKYLIVYQDLKIDPKSGVEYATYGHTFSKSPNDFLEKSKRKAGTEENKFKGDIRRVWLVNWRDPENIPNQVFGVESASGISAVESILDSVREQNRGNMKSKPRVRVSTKVEPARPKLKSYHPPYKVYLAC